jgi:hypothetical protein
MRKTAALASLLVLFIGCDSEPGPEPLPGSPGAECSQFELCDNAHGIPVNGQGWVACVNEAGICWPDDAPCDGICQDMADPASMCPIGFDRCKPEGFCTDTNLSEENCGGCGQVCPGGVNHRQCWGGECCLWDENYEACNPV